MRIILLYISLTILGYHSSLGQKMTLEEYEMLKDFRIENLDEDTYVKISSQYVLDRYQMKPPYFIAGDGDTKNRVDLYKFIKRDDLSELGLLMVYTHISTGEVKHLCLPFTAEKEVWDQYYDDLKYSGQENPAMAFAISSVLAKELSNIFVSGEAGDDYEVESSDYDICFPPDAKVLVSDGSTREISQIRVGEKVQTIGERGIQYTQVTEIQVHKGNFPIMKIRTTPVGIETASVGKAGFKNLSFRATPNHPVLTDKGAIKVSNLNFGDEILGDFNDVKTKFQVNYISISGSSNTVYNLVTESGSYIVDSILVSDKKTD